jgi:anti-sigma28 factor (negative regulator of flagellin synthesis)
METGMATMGSIEMQAGAGLGTVRVEAASGMDRHVGAATLGQARLAKIARLRQSIAEGTYHVPAAEVADAMMRRLRARAVENAA